MAALASDWLRHIRLLLWNGWTEFNESWQEARSQRPLPSLCFLSRLENKMATLASDWLRHFQLLLWNRWTEFNETWQEARSQCPLPSLCFSGPSEKQDGCPGLWLAETYSTSPLKRLNRIPTKVDRKQDLNTLYQVCVFWADRKTRWPPWPLIGWDIFNFSSVTLQEARSQCPLPSLCFSDRSEKQDGCHGLWLAETFFTSSLTPLNRIPTKLDRKQDLKALYQVCVFQVDQKNKMATPGSDWIRHFWLFLWNPLTEFNETWQEARSQHPLPGLRFSGRSEKQDGRPGLWLTEKFSASLMKPRTEFKETWQKARSQSPLPSLCFSGWSGKQDGRPSLWLAETFSTSFLKPLNRIWWNLTGSKISMSFTKSVFFGPIFKKKMAAMAHDWLRHFWLLLWNCWTGFKEIWQEARSQYLLPSCVFQSDE